MTGSIVAMILPFRDGQIDYPQVDKLIDYHIENKTDGILVCGTTGESATLSHDEHIELVRYVVDKADGRIPIMAGTGSNSTAEALALAKEAEKAGAECHLSITPYYNKPNQEGIYRHFKAIAEEVALPMVLYNVPGRTGKNIEPETVGRLSELKNIIGIKEATGNIKQAIEIIEYSQDGFILLSGEDAANYPLLAIGGQGTISVTANIAPKKMSDMNHAWRVGDVAKARDLHYDLMPLHRAMFFDTNPIPVKTSALLMGIIDHLEFRSPICEMDNSILQKLKAVLKEKSLI